MRGNSHNKVSSVPSLDESSSSISHNSEEQKVIKTINLTLHMQVGVAATSLLALLLVLDATSHCTIAYDATMCEDNAYDDDFIKKQQREIEENFCIRMFTTVVV